VFSLSDLAFNVLTSDCNCCYYLNTLFNVTLKHNHIQLCVIHMQGVSFAYFVPRYSNVGRGVKDKIGGPQPTPILCPPSYLSNL